MAQDEVIAADLVPPDLAPVDPPATSEGICEDANGTFDVGSLCILASAPLGLPEGMGEIFGRNLVGSGMQVMTPLVSRVRDSRTISGE